MDELGVTRRDCLVGSYVVERANSFCYRKDKTLAGGREWKYSLFQSAFKIGRRHYTEEELYSGVVRLENVIQEHVKGGEHVKGVLRPNSIHCSRQS